MLIRKGLRTRVCACECVCVCTRLYPCSQAPPPRPGIHFVGDEVGKQLVYLHFRGSMNRLFAPNSCSEASMSSSSLALVLAILPKWVKQRKKFQIQQSPERERAILQSHRCLEKFKCDWIRLKPPLSWKNHLGLF